MASINLKKPEQGLNLQANLNEGEKGESIVLKMRGLAERAKRFYDGGCYCRALALGGWIRSFSNPGEVEMVKVKKPGDFIHPSPLFSDGTDWNYHNVISYLGIIYDPLVGVPLTRKDYLDKMFPNQTGLIFEEGGYNFY